MSIRYDWTIEELEALNSRPLFELISQAHHLHAQFHRVGEIHVCSLISVKTGGCSEDCSYCAQSSRYKTNITPQAMMTYEEAIDLAKQAISRGATRICLGAAWREVRDNKQFDEIIKMVYGIKNLGVEVCCTLGMIKTHQAIRLKEAGLYAYNHNLDSSENFYRSVVTTRKYRDRLDTLDIASTTGLSICCGGILGLGESHKDRLELLLTLSRRNPHPESVPINRLTPVSGTPLENNQQVSIWEMVRIIALSRILMPQAMIRLSSGRQEMNLQDQTLCFFAGANSIHEGEKLLTVANTPIDQDREMFEILGLKKRQAYSHCA